MTDASVKSTGQLVDEVITNAFKSFVSRHPEYDLRYELLRTALDARLGAEVAGLLHDLALVSMATWQAQEVLMHEADDHVAARAGRQAQRVNAHRSRIIRELDRLLGDAGITVTTKTYE